MPDGNAGLTLAEMRAMVKFATRERDGALAVPVLRCCGGYPIESGLSPGDWVVTEGVQRAFPGAKVDPQRSQLASADPEPAAGAEKAASPNSDQK